MNEVGKHYAETAHVVIFSLCEISMLGKFTEKESRPVRSRGRGENGEILLMGEEDDKVLQVDSGDDYTTM